MTKTQFGLSLLILLLLLIVYLIWFFKSFVPYVRGHWRKYIPLPGEQLEKTELYIKTGSLFLAAPIGGTLIAWAVVAILYLIFFGWLVVQVISGFMHPISN